MGIKNKDTVESIQTHHSNVKYCKNENLQFIKNENMGKMLSAKTKLFHIHRTSNSTGNQSWPQIQANF